MRRPAARLPWVIFLPVMSLSARNMPVDSIITTIITSVMVRIRIGSKIGMPKWNGGISANQCGLGDLVEVHHARAPAAMTRADDDAEQHRDVRQEALGEAGDADDDREHDRRERRCSCTGA